jgi:hypothetical protein
MIFAHPRLRRFSLVLAALALSAALPLKADLIELTNGDHYRGKVIGMDSNNIDFVSEIQGRVHLPRNKVAQITFHEVTARPVASTNTAPVAATPVAAAPLILYGPNSLYATNSPAAGAPAPAGSATAEEVVQQMRQQGVQPQLINQVQEQIFGKASPEASQKFEEIMNGLVSGQISVQDLRVQAQSAIKQARDAKKELGGDAGEMLDGYIGILEKFVAESDPSVSTPAPAPVAKSAPGPASFSASTGTR